MAKGNFVASLLIACAVIAVPATAKWGYVSTDAMIQDSEIIAVVNIGPIQDTNAPEKSLECHQMAQASVEQALKGSPPKSITIYGGINCKGFVACVPDVLLSSGRSLVFLRRKGADGNGFISANADRGIQKITNDTIIWHDDTNREGKPMKLRAVTAMIKPK